MPCRLVTLIGPGGIGKTRLALEFARQAVSRFGSWCGFVSLAEVTHLEKINAQIAVALRIPLAGGTAPLDQVIAYLEEQDNPGSPSLLILDNLEHLLPGEEEDEPGENHVIDLVHTLQGQVPGLLLICTSRRPLKVRGERLLPIHPLPLPSLLGERQGQEDLADLYAVPSIRLYIDRAQSVRPDFGLTPTNAQSIAALCRQLEGSPLALELAAAWVRVLPPRKMWERLTQGLDMPAGSYADLPARHRSLTAALEWSFRLLSPSQQRLFAQLSVFRGGWTFESAEGVCSEPDTFRLLSSLVEASLVNVAEAEEQVRYDFLETVRAFSRQQCAHFGESDLLPRRHAEFFLSLAVEAEPHQRDTDQALWLARLDSEHDNLRAALAWYQSDTRSVAEWNAGVKMLGLLYRFWIVRGYWREGLSYSEKVLARESTEIPPRLYARILNGSAALCKLLGDRLNARTRYERALEILQELDDQQACGDLLHNLGYLALEDEDLPRAQKLYEQSLEIARTSGSTIHIADELHHLGMVAHEWGDLEKAQTLYHESLTLRKPLGDKRGIGFTIQNLANIATTQDRFAESQRLQEENLAIRRELGDRMGIADALQNLGQLALRQNDVTVAKPLLREGFEIRIELGTMVGISGSLELVSAFALQLDNPQTAARLAGAAHALLSELGITPSPSDQKGIDTNRAIILERLTTAEFDSAYNAGRALTWQSAVAEALGLLSS